MINRNVFSVILLGGLFLFSSCRTTYRVTQVTGGRVAMDSTWDERLDAEAVALVAPYKARIDSVMSRVIGQAAHSMNAVRPESTLSNLVADVLREAAADVLGRSADMGLVNMGGLRSVLTQGPVTVATAYEILPFENTLCILTVKGKVLKQLFQNIAARGGEGVSGVKLVITADGKLLKGMVGGSVIDDSKLYTVATIDYLAEGNDGMSALVQAENKVCPEDGTLRNLFIRYVEKQTAAGRKVASQMEGRIAVK